MWSAYFSPITGGLTRLGTSLTHSGHRPSTTMATIVMMVINWSTFMFSTTRDTLTRPTVAGSMGSSGLGGSLLAHCDGVPW
jgi:hypothetical protein